MIVPLGNVMEAQSSPVGLFSRLAGKPVPNSSRLLHPAANTPARSMPFQGARSAAHFITTEAK